MELKLRKRYKRTEDKKNPTVKNNPSVMNFLIGSFFLLRKKIAKRKKRSRNGSSERLNVAPINKINPERKNEILFFSCKPFIKKKKEPAEKSGRNASLMGIKRTIPGIKSETKLLLIAIFSP